MYTYPLPWSAQPTIEKFSNTHSIARKTKEALNALTALTSLVLSVCCASYTTACGVCIFSAALAATRGSGSLLEPGILQAYFTLTVPAGLFAGVTLMELWVDNLPTQVRTMHSTGCVGYMPPLLEACNILSSLFHAEWSNHAAPTHVGHIHPLSTFWGSTAIAPPSTE